MNTKGPKARQPESSKGTPADKSNTMNEPLETPIIIDISKLTQK